MITKEEYLKGQTLPEQYEEIMKELLKRLNNFRAEYGKPMIVTSGYRTHEHNKEIGGSPFSKHCMASACDFADSDSDIKTFVLNDPDVLARCGLYMEHPAHCPRHVHLDIYERINRIFIP